MESKYAEENISTKQPTPREKARVPSEDGDQKRPGRVKTPQGERPQTPDSSALLRFCFPKGSRLLRRADFVRVYATGKRFEGRFMTVFILPGKTENQRVGVTATKKAIGKAHDRNRAKRLLRETFRLSRAELDRIETKYDWVINARRSLVFAKLEKPLAEFRVIAEKVRKIETSVDSPPASQETGKVG